MIVTLKVTVTSQPEHGTRDGLPVSAAHLELEQGLLRAVVGGRRAAVHGCIRDRIEDDLLLRGWEDIRNTGFVQ